MKAKVTLGFVVIMLFVGCSQTQNEDEFVSIGEKKWYVSFPANYVSFGNLPKRDSVNYVCGNKMDVQTTQLLHLQQDDTIWVDPIPNSINVFLIPAKYMNVSSDECAKKLTDRYTLFIEYGSKMNYEHVDQEISIDGVKFLETENFFKDSAHVLSHGSLEYMGTVGDNWMYVQVSYNNVKERDKLRQIIVKSRFE